MDTHTVLVTGAGALLGQGILRSLRMSQLPLRILTADPDPRAAGHWLGDGAYRTEMARSPQFLPRLEEVIAQQQVSVLLVGTDVELPCLARERTRLREVYGVQVIVSPPQAIEIADDKWLTAEFLRQHGLPYPRSAPLSDLAALEGLIEEIGFPLFVKPRIGARSYGAQQVANRQQLSVAAQATQGLVAQELLPEESGEFTAGCLVEEGKCVAVVAMKRDLRDGNTYRAYAVPDCPHAPLLAQLAERLEADGPVNFQYRVRDGEPVVFEINSRFSGTTPLRAMFGFNEVEALLAKRLYGQTIQPPRIRPGVVLRAWADVFVQDEQMTQLRDEHCLPHPRGEHYPFHPADV